ncbi:MAG: dimethylsulfonioproprionate lyase family protein [Pseudomonadota bacterium]
MTDAVPAPVAHLMASATELLRAKADLLDLTEADLASIRPGEAPPPTHFPALALFDAMRDQAEPETLAVVEAVLTARPYLHWRQTYSEEDGFDRSYLDRYCWCDLAGPQGPYRAQGIRIMIGYWGQGLVYPDHSHPPEEHYLILSGAAWIGLGRDPLRRHGPGDVFHTPPGAVHSAEMREAPLLALAIWRGADLGVRIHLPGSDGIVSMA